MTVTFEPPPVEDLDAGVIKEARARQRRHRALAAIVALAAAVVAAALVSGGGPSCRAT